MLGEPMYFEVSAAYISEDERIFVDSCYAAASTDPKSIPQHDVICNYGYVVWRTLLLLTLLHF